VLARRTRCALSVLQTIVADGSGNRLPPALTLRPALPLIPELPAARMLG
jgi:hypothetical protein